MFKSYNGLGEQLASAQFRNMSFTVYNFIQDEGYMFRLKRNGYKDIGIDELEFFQFKLTDDVKNDIKNDTDKVCRAFKRHIENELQNDGVLGIFLMKEYGIMVAVKPKSFDMKEAGFFK